MILSNGPGELTTWVRPAVQALRQQLGEDRAKVRLSVVLSPCPHASGREVAIARSYPEVDRVQAPEHFLPFLLWGQTADHWQWRETGVVLFLGGDQFFAAVIGKRLGYRTVVYAEWEARWHWLINCFGVMKPEIIARARPKYAHKFTVVGDLISSVYPRSNSCRVDGMDKTKELIGLLPGSKPAKLARGVPLSLAIAREIYKQRPQVRFGIPVAPTLDIETLARFANAKQNPIIQQWPTGVAELARAGDRFYLQTPSGLQVELWTEFPAYDLLLNCRLCLTTVGANTAELGCLAVPMIILLPTQQLDAMRAWDGLPGLIANLPGVGSAFATLINWLVLRQKHLFAWPNIWAGETIVPELVGKLQAPDVAALVVDFLENPEKLELMRDRLRAVRGKPGAAQKLARLVVAELKLSYARHNSNVSQSNN